MKLEDLHAGFVHNPTIDYDNPEHIKKEVGRLCRLLKYLGEADKEVDYEGIAEPLLEAIQILSRRYLEMTR